jgi:hypothetical protein
VERGPERDLDHLGTEFILPNRDVVSEETWPEYEANGFIWDMNRKQGRSAEVRINFLQGELGAANVLTGDPFDQELGCPIRRPGETGIYCRLAKEDHTRSPKSGVGGERQERASKKQDDDAEGKRRYGGSRTYGRAKDEVEGD